MPQDYDYDALEEQITGNMRDRTFAPSKPEPESMPMTFAPSGPPDAMPARRPPESPYGREQALSPEPPPPPTAPLDYAANPPAPPPLLVDYGDEGAPPEPPPPPGMSWMNGSMMASAQAGGQHEPGGYPGYMMQRTADGQNFFQPTEGESAGELVEVGATDDANPYDGLYSFLRDLDRERAEHRAAQAEMAVAPSDRPAGVNDPGRMR